MTGPQPQYLRSAPRQRAQRALMALPEWTRVRLRGSEPREIRSAEQLIEWISSYGPVVAKIVAERDDARDKFRGLSGWEVGTDEWGSYVIHTPCRTQILGHVLAELVVGTLSHECPVEPGRELDPRERAAGEES